MQGKDESGRVFCERRCAVYQAACRNDPPPTVDVQVNARSGARKWINVTTLLVPARSSGLSLLVHLFRDVNQSREVRDRLLQELREANLPSASGVAAPLLEPLPPREAQVLRMLAAGASTDSICRQLLIGKATVRSHVHQILTKLGVHSRLEAVAAAVQHGIL